MRRRRNKGGDDAEVDMTPMLDIVFIMLIFFIVTATFLDEEGIDINQPPPPPDPPPDSEILPGITVYVNQRNLCSVDGESTDCGRVSARVETLLAEKPGASIILKIHEDAETGYMVTLKDEFDDKQRQTKIEIVQTS